MGMLYRLARTTARAIYPHGVAGWCVSSLGTASMTLRQLGYAADTRLLIVNADDFGMSEEVNSAILAGLHGGLVTSTSVMVPCPAFRSAVNIAMSDPDADIGVHLTLTSEWTAYRWQPVLGPANVPSLVDSDGCFWSTPAEVFAHGRLDEVEAELRAQIETALDSGIDVTHLDSHMFVLQSSRSDYYHLYMKLAQDYRVPFRSIRRSMLHWCTRVDVGALRPRRLGVVAPDHLIFAGSYDGKTARKYWSSLLRTLRFGVTEAYCHPGFARAQLQRFAVDADQRQADYDFFTSVVARQLLLENNVRLITYRTLRNCMRNSTGLQ
jgi:predicted glycoside hydrolase/deacetylase ChbG (UPF0249 family)